MGAQVAEAPGRPRGGQAGGGGRTLAEWEALAGAPVGPLADRLRRAGLARDGGGFTLDPGLAERIGVAAGERLSALHARAASQTEDPLARVRHLVLGGDPDAAHDALAALTANAVNLDWRWGPIADRVADRIAGTRPEEAALLRATLHLHRRNNAEAVRFALAATGGSAAVRARALAITAAAGSRADPASAAEHAAAAVAAWEALGDLDAAREARITLSEIGVGRGDPAAQALLAAVRDSASGLTRVRAAGLLAHARMGHPDALSAMAAARDAARDAGSTFHVAAFGNNLGDRMRREGRTAEAAIEYAASAAAFRRIGSLDEVIPRLNAALMRRDEPAAACAELAVLAARLERQGRDKLLAGCRLAQAAALARLGRWVEAEPLAGSAAALLVRTGFVSPEVDTIVADLLQVGDAAGRTGLRAALAAAGVTVARA